MQLPKLLCSVLYISCFASLALADDPAPSAPQEEAMHCDTVIMSRPGGATLMDATSSFRADLETMLNSCQLQNQFPARAHFNYFLRSFTQGDDGRNTAVYYAIDFTDANRPMSTTCTLIQTSTYVSQDSWRSTYTQTCTPFVEAH